MRKHTGWMLVFVMAAALLAASCGGDDDTEGVTPTPDLGPPWTPAPDPEILTGVEPSVTEGTGVAVVGDDVYEFEVSGCLVGPDEDWLAVIARGGAEDSRPVSVTMDWITTDGRSSHVIVAQILPGASRPADLAAADADIRMGQGTQESLVTALGIDLDQRWLLVEGIYAMVDEEGETADTVEGTLEVLCGSR